MGKKRMIERRLRKKKELKTRIVNHATLGHLFFRPSAHFPYSTSANCFVCFIPGIALPGKFFCFSVHVSSVGISDCRRLWLLRCGLFCASTSFGVEVPEGCEDGGGNTGGGSKCESLGSLHQNISLLKKDRNTISPFELTSESFQQLASRGDIRLPGPPRRDHPRLALFVIWPHV